MMLDSVELHVVPARHLRRIVARVSRNWRRRWRLCVVRAVTLELYGAWVERSGSTSPPPMSQVRMQSEPVLDTVVITVLARKT
jgi:hypothetical protein